MIGLPDESSKKSKKYGAVSIAAIVVVIVFFSTNLFAWSKILLLGQDTDICPIVKIERPELFYKDNSTVTNILQGDEFRKVSAEKLLKAVQVDTQIYDDPPEVDSNPEYWAKFKKFHKYLEKTFPTVYEHLEVNTVNTYGLVFYWKGSNSKLKPLMLTAHQDVVPVQEETLGDWSHPPFEGYFDGKTMFGRGVSDCKNVLVSIMETLEILIKQDFKPERGIIAAFGMDEEVSGWHGALHIAGYLEERFGKDGIYAIIDEGAGLTKDPFTGNIIAMPGTGEKGYVDVEISLTTPGGHSSVPPDHTSIGILSELAYVIEQEQYEPVLTELNPTLHMLQCQAAHDHRKKIPGILRKLILRAGYDKVANSFVLKQLSKIPSLRYLMQTSQALDIISGGEKNNALPENAKLLVNHRVAIEKNVDSVKEAITKKVLAVAKKHDVGLNAFGKKLLEPTAKGNFDVHVSGKSTETAPVTPIGDELWGYVAGVTRHIFEDYVFTNLTDPVVVAPAIMTGNTDTRHYWNLTDHIYRYSPMFMLDFLKDTNVHSVDEHIEFDNHLLLLAFFYEFIQVVQQ